MGTEIKGLQNDIDSVVSSLHSHRVQQQFLQITEGDLIQAFGVTEDQMEKAAAMLGRNKKTKKWEIHQPDYQRAMK